MIELWFGINRGLGCAFFMKSYSNIVERMASSDLYTFIFVHTWLAPSLMSLGNPGHHNRILPVSRRRPSAWLQFQPGDHQPRPATISLASSPARRPSASKSATWPNTTHSWPLSESPGESSSSADSSPLFLPPFLPVKAAIFLSRSALVVFFSCSSRFHLPRPTAA